MMDDKAIMTRVIDMARDNVADGGMPYAAIIVRDGAVIATGVNGTHKSHDPSDHAEMAAIREASRILGTPDLSGCEIYVVGQPCAMCLGCLVMAKLTKVVFAVDTDVKDSILTHLPHTGALYDVLGHDFGASAITYKHMPEYSPQGEAMFKAWNNR